MNQVVHVWPYESLQHRMDVREAMAKDEELAQHRGTDLIVQQESEIYIPAPFMREMGGDQALGNVYEMRSYTFLPGAMPGLLESWGKGDSDAGGVFAAGGGDVHRVGRRLNKWVHIWPYQDMNERDRVRAQTRADGVWPPGGDYRELMVKQENKVLAPAPFSPMH